MIDNTRRRIILSIGKGLLAFGQLLDAINSADGSSQSYNVLDGSRNIPASDTWITLTCYLTVTASDGVTKSSEYQIYYQ